MRTSHFWNLLLLVPFLLLGCSNPREIQTEGSATETVTDFVSTGEVAPTSSVTSTTTQQATRTITPTLAPPTQTAAPPSPTQKPILVCNNNGNPELPQGEYGFDGAIAYESKEDYGFYLVGGQPLVYTQLPITPDWTTSLIGFSPNGEWLASSDNQATIDLLSSSGEKKDGKLAIDQLLALLPDDASLGGWTNQEWINNELIFSGVSYWIPDYENTNFIVRTIHDPFHETWNNEQITSLPNRLEDGGVFFSLDLAYALYVDDQFDLILWDQVKGEKRWYEANFENPRITQSGLRVGFNYVEWSPSSSLVAYIGPEELNSDIPSGKQQGVYILDTTVGEEQLISNFLGQYESFNIYEPRWSADNRYLSFILSTWSGENNQQIIFVYDTQQREYTFQCPLVDIGSYQDATSFWSPDGRYIVYSYSIFSPLVVVDIRTGMVVQLAEKTMVAGWSGRFSASGINNDR